MRFLNAPTMTVPLLLRVALPWKRGPKKLALRVKSHLVLEFNLSTTYVNRLRCVERSGWFAGAPATYLKVFDPSQAEEREVRVWDEADLSANPALVLFQGHIEEDGALYFEARAGFNGKGPVEPGSSSESPEFFHQIKRR